MDVERFVLKRGSGEKRVILVLNKIDLIPRESAEKWLKYLREEMPTVAFKSSTQAQKSNLGRKRKGARAVSEGGGGMGAWVGRIFFTPRRRRLLLFLSIIITISRRRLTTPRTARRASAWAPTLCWLF